MIEFISYLTSLGSVYSMPKFKALKLPKILIKEIWSQLSLEYSIFKLEEIKIFSNIA